MTKWTQNITPKNEIITQPINESMFAARLDEVAVGRGMISYKDPIIFFDNTHITKGMTKLLNIVAKTFETNKCPGNNVIELQTSFGGGKTHCLVSLYHIAQRPDLLKSHRNLKTINFPSPRPDLKVNNCVLVGMDFNVSKPRQVKIDGKSTPLNTWWGEIAYQLGGEKSFKIVQANDKDWTAPSKSTLNEMFQSIDGVSIILLDEIVHYLINLNSKNPDYYAVTIIFFQVLVEEVTNHQNVILVFTLPASDLELVNVFGRQAFNTIDKHTKRHKTTLEPIEYIEIYYIIRKRLFEPLNQTQQDNVTRICDKFWKFYNKKKDTFPKSIFYKDPTGQNMDYIEKMQIAYPFHPALIDVLYEKWGPHPDFQRTRGILRVFAKILQIAFKTVTTDMITVGDVPLMDVGVKGELLSYLDSNFGSVLTTDYKKASELEDSIGDDYLNYHLGQQLFTGIFFHSMRLAQSAIGATKEELCLSVLKPEIKYPALITDMLEKMKNYLFHLFKTGENYAISTQVNHVVLVLAEKERISQNPGDIEDFIELYLDKAIPKAHKVICWPIDSKQIPDDARIIKIALSTQYILSKGMVDLPEKMSKELNEWLEKRGTVLREKKNGLIFIFLDQAEYNAVREQTVELMATQNVLKQDQINKNLEKHQKDILYNSKKKLELELPQSIVKAYSFLGRPNIINQESGAKIILTLYQIENTKTNFTQRVEHEMIKRDWLLESIGRKILPTNFQDCITTQELWDRQFSLPGLELLKDETVLKTSIQNIIKSTKSGLPKYGYGILLKGKLFEDSLKPDDFDLFAEPGEILSQKQIKISDLAYVISEEYITKIKANIPPPEPQPPGPEPQPSGPEPQPSGPQPQPPGPEPQPPGPEPSDKYSIKMKISVPWDRVNDLRRGMVNIMNVLGKNNPSTVATFELHFLNKEKLSNMNKKNLKKALDELKEIWGENIEIEIKE